MKFGTVTQISPYTGQAVKISNFAKKNKTAAAAILKITKIAISPQLFDRFLTEVWCANAKWVSYPLRLLNKLNFTNPRWRTAAILKTVK